MKELEQRQKNGDMFGTACLPSDTLSAFTCCSISSEPPDTIPPHYCVLAPNLDTDPCLNRGHTVCQKFMQATLLQNSHNLSVSLQRYPQDPPLFAFFQPITWTETLWWNYSHAYCQISSPYLGRGECMSNHRPHKPEDQRADGNRGTKHSTNKDKLRDQHLDP